MRAGFSLLPTQATSDSRFSVFDTLASPSAEVDSAFAPPRVRHAKVAPDSGEDAKQQAKRTYRPDIDGLRAVAVGLVVLFHTGVPAFSGGFIGVDVFFVISGYLITSILIREMDRGTFSILDFYERRVRRIVPALVPVLLFCCLAAYFLLLPSDLVHFAQSIFAAVFSYSNLYFWRQAGYFEQTHVRFLLHTWSLAVEEQFYLVFPLILLALQRKPGLRRVVIAWLAMVSFGVAEYLVLTHRTELAFFMPFSRAWELLAGSALSLKLVRVPETRWARETIGFAGGGLILLAVCLLAPTTPFPGAAALLPCLGAALLLAAGEGQGSMVSSLLSMRPLVFLGLISYSLYLWHWPLVLCARICAFPGINDKGPLHKGAVLVASIAAAWLSWRFVERPFRLGGGGAKCFSQKEIFRGAAAAACLICSVGILYASSGGLSYRFPARAVQVGRYLDFTGEGSRNGICFITSASHFSDFRPETCTALDPNRPNYLLFGDSHAAALWTGMDQEFHSVHILQANASGCAPTLGDYDSTNCGKMRSWVFEQLLPSKHVDGVILTEHWKTAADFARVAPAIRWLQARRIAVIVVGPAQEYDVPLPILLAYGISRKSPGLAEKHLLPGLARLDQTMAEDAQRANVRYLSLWQASCGGGRCTEYADAGKTIPMLFDTNHLNNEASVLMARRWAGQFRDWARLAPPAAAPAAQGGLRVGQR